MRTASRQRIIATMVFTMALIGAASSPASADNRDAVQPIAPTASSTSVMTKPKAVPIARPQVRTLSSPLPSEQCSATFATKAICVAPAKPSGRAFVAPSALLPFPAWCADSDGEPVAALRTEACRITGMLLTTRETVNGVTRITGELSMDVYDYEIASVDRPNWEHQIGLSPWSGWGAAVNATATGTLATAGDCTTNGAPAFPAQSMSPVNRAIRAGTAGAVTTATTVGAMGACTTTWNLVFTVAGYPPAPGSSSADNVACDNVTGANGTRPARVGCVIWWFPALVTYSQTSYPALASHVSRAQGSGLPGATFANPLNRTSDASIITRNRSLACGDAPSITNKSCDEYPLASTYQGLNFGGTRRTFANCNINAPTNVTGPTGASACMITASENNAQGGIMAKFYYDFRVLEGDPFRVGIGS